MSGGPSGSGFLNPLFVYIAVRDSSSSQPDVVGLIRERGIYNFRRKDLEQKLRGRKGKYDGQCIRAAFLSLMGRYPSSQGLRGHSPARFSIR